MKISTHMVSGIIGEANIWPTMAISQILHIAWKETHAPCDILSLINGIHSTWQSLQDH